MSKEGLPVCVRGGEFAQLKHISEIVLRAQQVSQTLTIGPWLECSPIQQAVQHIPRPLERHVEMVPFRLRKRTEILMACFVFPETDLACFLDAAPDSHVR